MNKEYEIEKGEYLVDTQPDKAKECVACAGTKSYAPLEHTGSGNCKLKLEVNPVKYVSFNNDKPDTAKCICGVEKHCGKECSCAYKTKPQPDKAQGWEAEFDKLIIQMSKDKPSDEETSELIKSFIRQAIEEAVKEEREVLWDAILIIFASNSGLKLKEVKKLFKDIDE